MLYSARALEPHTPALHRTQRRWRWVWWREEAGGPSCLLRKHDEREEVDGSHEVSFPPLRLCYAPAALCLTNTHCAHGFVESSKYSDLFCKYDLSASSQ